MTQQQNNEWEERFKDFYWEQGEYKDRKLGLDEYINFISQELEKAYQKGKEEKYEDITKIIDAREKQYNLARKATLEEVETVINKELLTWAKESIGAKAVESVMMALQQLNKLKEKEFTTRDYSLEEGKEDFIDDDSDYN